MAIQLLILASSILPFATLPGIYWLNRIRVARRDRAAASADARSPSALDRAVGTSGSESQLRNTRRPTAPSVDRFRMAYV